ncbi:hypothetical protein [Novispirillum itersonii]|uniref:hypothetical protein n=1 Tax=Novispirillum itersonii TaxID=189 RepID=UPI00146DA6CF|nr:hypothetical protein [Novispirillum itersonii]
MFHDGKNLLDLASLVLVFGAIAQYLPAIAAILSIIWTAIRIIDWIQSKRG